MRAKKQTRKDWRTNELGCSNKNKQWKVISFSINLFVWMSKPWSVKSVWFIISRLKSNRILTEIEPCKVKKKSRFCLRRKQFDFVTFFSIFIKRSRIRRRKEAVLIKNSLLKLNHKSDRKSISNQQKTIQSNKLWNENKNRSN